ncbi:hypothetical protein VTN31DRAFT_1055 [Thermomyces dupontii]|uniref:uncharacterized protein n=1 Tax=Talaromyces thermophilus TaxID=28565 RepID=UPI003742A6EE
MSLSKTLTGLHWHRVPNDTDGEVAARGILYLLIFQQLGQLVRWSWGYHVLLAPKDRFVEEASVHSVRVGQEEYTDHPHPTDPDEPLIRTVRSHEALLDPACGHSTDFDSGTQTPVYHGPYSYTKLPTEDGAQASARDNDEDGDGADQESGPSSPGHISSYRSPNGDILSFPRLEERAFDGQSARGFKGFWHRCRRSMRHVLARSFKSLQDCCRRMFHALPAGVQKTLTVSASWLAWFFSGLWAFMNPPLWAMLVAILVASIPRLQALFFNEGTFVRNSITRAIEQNGRVAVPLILVVLGANLARNTLPTGDAGDYTHPKEERNLIIASLVARMLLPTVIMAPILALLAKYAPISIIDDPIFVVVCFLLTGAPSALQLAQICQLNNVFMGAMSRILFQSYLIW